MAERKPTGVLIALSSCTDPSKEAEFNKWYNDVHIPDILQSGCYYKAYRYENTRVKEDQPRYAALYLTDRPDPVAAFKEMRSKLKAPRIDFIKGFGTYTYLYAGPEDRVTAQAKARLGIK